MNVWYAARQMACVSFTLHTPNRSDRVVRELTLQETFDLRQLGRIVQFPKIFRLLRQVFALHCRVSLVGDNVGRSIVKCRDQGGQVDVL